MIVFRCFQSRKVEILIFVFRCWKKTFQKRHRFVAFVFCGCSLGPTWHYQYEQMWISAVRRKPFCFWKGSTNISCWSMHRKKRLPFFRHRLTVNYAVISSLEIYWLQNTLDLLFWFKSNLWLQSICDIFWSQSPAYLMSLAFTKLCCFQQENFMPRGMVIATFWPRNVGINRDLDDEMFDLPWITCDSRFVCDSHW